MTSNTRPAQEFATVILEFYVWVGDKTHERYNIKGLGCKHRLSMAKSCSFQFSFWQWRHIKVKERLKFRRPPAGSHVDDGQTSHNVLPLSISSFCTVVCLTSKSIEVKSKNASRRSRSRNSNKERKHSNLYIQSFTSNISSGWTLDPSPDLMHQPHSSNIENLKWNRTSSFCGGAPVYELMIWPDQVSCLVPGFRWVITTSTAWTFWFLGGTGHTLYVTSSPSTGTYSPSMLCRKQTHKMKRCDLAQPLMTSSWKV